MKNHRVTDLKSNFDLSVHLVHFKFMRDFQNGMEIILRQWICLVANFWIMIFWRQLHHSDSILNPFEYYIVLEFFQTCESASCWPKRIDEKIDYRKTFSCEACLALGEAVVWFIVRNSLVVSQAPYSGFMVVTMSVFTLSDVHCDSLVSKINKTKMWLNLHKRELSSSFLSPFLTSDEFLVSLKFW